MRLLSCALIALLSPLMFPLRIQILSQGAHVLPPPALICDHCILHAPDRLYDEPLAGSALPFVLTSQDNATRHDAGKELRECIRMSTLYQAPLLRTHDCPSRHQHLAYAWTPLIERCITC